MNDQEKIELEKLREFFQACGVFFTPLERLKNWNEYKEAAAKIRSDILIENTRKNL